MELFKLCIKRGGMVVGLSIGLASTISLAKDISEWGLPIWSWYLIGLLIFAASSAFVIIELHRENKTLREKTRVITDSDIKLMEWRKEYRKSQTPEVSQIPATLKNMWALVNNIAEEKKQKKRPSKELLRNALVKLLEIDENDPILKTTSYTTEDQIRKIVKRVRAKMGLKKPDAELEAKWRRRIAEKMDDYKIGLMLKQNHEYKSLSKQLGDNGKSISKTMIYHTIDNFVENLSALYSIKLLMFYGGTEKRLYIFPREMRDWLKHLEDIVERALRTNLTQVNGTLEEYSIGGEFKDK